MSIEFEGDPTLAQDLQAISDALKIAEKHHLEVEVIAWAFQAKEATPFMSIAECLQYGINEWIK